MHLLSIIAHNWLTTPNKLKLATHCYQGSTRHFPYWRSLPFCWITLGRSIHRTFWSQWHVRRSKQTAEEKTCSACTDVQNILYRKCCYLRTFLSVEETGNSVLDPKGLLTMAAGPLEEEGSRKMDSDSLSSWIPLLLRSDKPCFNKCNLESNWSHCWVHILVWNQSYITKNLGSSVYIQHFLKCLWTGTRVQLRHSRSQAWLRKEEG